MEGGSPQDTAAQIEAAAAQLEAARRARDAETRDNAIQEVEMVLQTYFHNLDNTYNKLAAINENMDDVEVSFSHHPLPAALLRKANIEGCGGRCNPSVGMGDGWNVLALERIRVQSQKCVARGCSTQQLQRRPEW